MVRMTLSQEMKADSVHKEGGGRRGGKNRLSILID